MTDMNNIPLSPEGDGAQVVPGAHVTPGASAASGASAAPGAQQPPVLQPTYPTAPAHATPAQSAQFYSYTGDAAQDYAHAGAGEGAQGYGYAGESAQNYGYAGTSAQGYGYASAQPTPNASAYSYNAGQIYEAEPVVARAQHAAAPKGNGGKTFLIAFAGALVACVLAFGVWGVVGSFGGKETIVDPTTGESIVIAPSEDATLAEAVAAKCLPSVAAITVYAEMSSGDIMSQYYGYGYGGGAGGLQAYSQGSGVVLTEDGYVITNNHVVEGGSAFDVMVAGETYEAELVGADPSSDVAVLKCKDASGLTVMEIGDSDDLTIGEWVMTLGSPFGLEQSVATGIVSATSRSQIMDASASVQQGGSGEITIYPNMIQTDAAINPGNSGGALVDDEGKLIGINTLITSYSGNYSGVGFAIPVNYAISLAQQIIAGEKPTHAQLGVSLSTVDAQNALRYGLPVDSGAYVASVVADSGAALAGIRPGDIITAFDGESVESASDLMLDVRTKNPGDTVTLTVNSGGQERDVEVTLGDDAASQQQEAPQPQQQNQDGSSNGYGLEDLFGYGR